MTGGEMLSEGRAEGDGRARTIEICAALTPADAGAARDRLVAAFDGAGAEGIALDLDGEAPMPCALQLLVAARRTAEARGVPCRLGDRATAAQAALSIDQPKE